MAEGGGIMSEFFKTLQNEGFQWLIAAVMIVGIIVGSLLAYNIMDDINDRKLSVQMAEAGMEQVILPGSTYPKWQKAK